MFEDLKNNKGRKSEFYDRPNAGDYPRSSGYSKSAGATSSVVKGNERKRLIRCQHCGWICDRERDTSLKNGMFAGWGIFQGDQKQADNAAGDAQSIGWGGSGWGSFPWGGGGGKKSDRYYDRDVQGGCPCCGSFLYDGKKR